MEKKVKITLPKRIAGLKIPKVVRKGPLMHFLNSSAGQLILAETVLGIAAAFAAAKTGRQAAAETLHHPIDNVRRVGHALSATRPDQSERLAHAFREAGRAFRNALHQSGTAAWEKRKETPPADAPAIKKSASRASSETHH